MRRLLGLIGAVVVATATVTMTTGGMAAAAGACSGTIAGMTIAGDLEVPPGVECVLDNVTVRGNLLVDPGSDLVLRQAITVYGSILSNPTMRSFSSLGASTVNVRGNVTLNGLTDGLTFVCEMAIGGSLAITNAAAAVHYVAIGQVCDTGPAAIGGNLTITGNAAPIYVGGGTSAPTVGGMVTVSNNSGGGHVANTSVRGVLVCTADDPTYTIAHDSVRGPNAGASGFCPSGTTGNHWISRDATTYTQVSWTVAPAIDELRGDFSGVYTTGSVAIGTPFTARWTSATAVLAFIPTTGSPSWLTTDAVNPTSTAAGSFLGDVLALRLNVDFGDTGQSANLAGVKFGDMTVCGLTDTPDLNKTSVRNVLTVANAAVGSTATTDTIDKLNSLVRNLDASFDGGTPTAWAQQHLANGTCV